MKLRLSHRFFFYLLCLTTVFIFGSYYFPLFLISCLLVLLFSYFVFFDYIRPIKTKEFFKFEINGRKVFLGNTIDFSISLDSQFSSNHFSSFEIVLHENPYFSLNLQTESSFSRGQVADGDCALKGVFVPRKIGFTSVKKFSIVLRSRLGFWERLEEVTIDSGLIQIWPEFQKISPQELKSQSLGIYDFGSRKARLDFSNDEFHSIRPFVFSDSLVNVDAKKSAKFRKLMTRTYESKRSNHFVIVLDKGRSMIGAMGESRKIDYYISAVLHLIERAHENRDEVTLILLGEKAEVLFSRVRRRKRINFWYELQNKIEPENKETNFTNLPKVLDRYVPKRSLLFLLTDISRSSVQEEAAHALKPTLRKHKSLVCGLIEDKCDLGYISEKLSQSSEHDFVDVLYSLWIEEETRKFGFRLSKNGGAIAFASYSKWLNLVEKCYSSLRNSV